MRCCTPNRGIVAMSHKTNLKAKVRWLISDELWKEIEPLLPNKKKPRPSNGGRPPASDRQAMEGIFFVLKTGCQWKALDVTCICSGAVAHRKFQEWRKAGVFKTFWKKGLQKYDRAIGINWNWLSLDASMVKAPVAGEKKQAKTRQIVENRERRGAS